MTMIVDNDHSRHIADNGMSIIAAILESQANYSDSFRLVSVPHISPLATSAASTYQPTLFTTIASITNGSLNVSKTGSSSVAEDGGTKLTFLLLLVVPLFAVIGNFLVVTSVVTQRKLRNNHTNYYISSLATSDFFIGLVVMPFGIYQLVNSNRWTLGEDVCKLYLISDVACSTASIMNLVMISVDRFAAIMFPRSYQESWRRPLRALCIIVLIWTLSGSVAVPLLIHRSATQLQTSGLAANGTLLNLSANNEIICGFESPDFMIYSSLFSFYLPASVVIPMYAVIYLKLRARARRKRNASLHTPQSAADSVSVDKFNNDPTILKSGGSNPAAERRKPIHFDHPSSIKEESEKLLDSQRQCTPPLPPHTGERERATLRQNGGPDHSEGKTRSISLANAGKPNPSSCSTQVTLIGISGAIQNSVHPSNEILDSITSTGCEGVPTNRCDPHCREHRADKRCVSNPDKVIVPHVAMSPIAIPHSVPNRNISVPTTAVACLKRTHGNNGHGELCRVKTTTTVLKPFRKTRFRSLISFSLTESDSETSSFEFSSEMRKRMRGKSLSERAARKILSFRDTITEGFKNRKLRENTMLRREQKATKLVAVVLACFLCCWSPFFSFNLFRGICLKRGTCAVEDPSHFNVFVAVTWLGYTNSLLNPVLYTLFNALYRDAFRQLLSCTAKCS